MRNLTIGGLAIDFTGSQKLDWLRFALSAYVDELVMYATYETGVMTDAELDIQVNQLLQKLVSCKTFADLPAVETEPEEIRIAAVLGLRLLHETVEALHAGQSDLDTLLIWNDMSLATREAATLWTVSLSRSASAEISERARSAAIARHTNGPFSEVRAFARDQLRIWEREPSMYKSLASFARDIADKFPIVTNPVIVERWVRGWRFDRSSEP